MCVLQQTVYDSTFSSINLSTFTEEDGTTINFFLLTQVLHILTKKMSPGSISFDVPGNQPAKICPKAN